jgi:hypothetical protein
MAPDPPPNPPAQNQPAKSAAGQTGPAEQIAAAKAAKELADAQLAAFKAAVGDVPRSGITGSVTLQGEKVGELEATLLAAHALKKAATTIAVQVAAVVAPNAGITVVAAPDVPAFQALLAYKAQHALVRTALLSGIQASSAFPSGRDAAALPMAGAAGVALDVASKLAGFFRSDFTVGGVALSLDEAAAVNEVAGQLCQKFVVVVPGVFNPRALTDAGGTVVTQVTDLSVSNQEAERRLAEHEAAADQLTRAIAAEADADRKRAFEDELTKHKTVLDSLRSAVALFATWMTKLSSADDKGVTSLATIAKEQAIIDGLAGGHLLTVKVQKAGGGFFVKKNLWTAFGEMPLYHMGGVAVTFALLEGSSGKVLASGAVPVYAGFVKSKEVQTTLLT